MTDTTYPGPLGEEAYRPAIHYTAADTWINDPNGLVYLDGEYHLFYQNNPEGIDHANMSWGHAVSTDLLHWEDRPVAIPCDEDEQIFSGSIVVDRGNTSGFGESGTSPLVAVYTSAYAERSPHQGIQAQSLAYSLDGGDTWTKHSGNPVLSRGSADFRDPKVFRYRGTSGEYWVMVAVEAVERKAVLYRSDNLREWTHLSDFEAEGEVGLIWECPDLFPLAVDGNPADVKWVLIVSLGRADGEGGSASVYFVGDFDGLAFTSTAGAGDAEYGWLDSGRDYYAAVSFDSAPDDRRVMVGWMNNWDYARVLPTSPWRGSMALPREIALKDDNGRTVLIQRPVPGLLPAGKPCRLDLRDVPEGTHRLPIEWDGAPFLIEATFDAGVSAEFGLVLRHGADGGTRLGYDVGRGEIILDRTESGQVDFHPSFPSVERARVALVGNRLRLQVYLDAASVEAFAQDGRTTFTEQVFPHRESTGFSLYAVGGTAQLLGLTATPLEPTPVVRERQRARAV